MKRRPTWGSRLRDTTLVLISLLWLLPVYLILVNAVTDASVYEGSPRWFPGHLGFFGNVDRALGASDFAITVRNSLFYATVCSLVAVVIATLASYAIVALNLKRPIFWFWLIYAGSLLPLQVFARPLYSAAANTNLYDTKLGLSIVYVALCIPFAMFVVRNVMATIPKEIPEAARLDGAGWLSMFFHVHVPLARSAMIAAFVFHFVFIWNELFFGITLSVSPNAQPVMATLAGMQGSYTSVGLPALLAIGVVVSLPTIVLFLLLQRFFVSSLRTNL